MTRGATVVQARQMPQKRASDAACLAFVRPRQVGSFDAGYGSTHMARLIGQKKAREMWFLARLYNAEQARNASEPVAIPGPTHSACLQLNLISPCPQALEMGLVNTVVPLAQLEPETLAWCREILRNRCAQLRGA